MKYRVTGRFYLVLLLVVLLFVYLFRGRLFDNQQVTVIMQGSASDHRTAQAVIIRDEQLITDTQVTRIEYTAQEATFVRAGEPVVSVYSLEYSNRLINDLNTTRKNIQIYHKILLGNELDAQLEVLNQEVKSRAYELKSLVNGSARGDVLAAVSSLSDAMAARRAYMASNSRSDNKLMKYYNEEEQRLGSITSWQQVKSAPKDGIVSFYTDGYESCLSADTVSSWDIETMRSVLNGTYQIPSIGKSETPIYRLFDQYNWYIALLSYDEMWNPTLETEYSFIMEGFDEIVYNGKVIRVIKDGTTTMAVLQVSDPIGALLYTRTGSVTIGADMSGLLVSSKAIAKQSGQDGVWLYDVPGGTFVPVDVITSRSDGTVLFTPLVDGVLTSGSQVLIK